MAAVECDAVSKGHSTLDVGRNLIGSELADPGSAIEMERSRELCGTSSNLGDNREAAVYDEPGSDDD